MSLLNKLQNIQTEYGCLPREALEKLAGEEKLSLAQLLGTASFYGHFSFEKSENDYIENLYPCRKAGILLNAPENYTWTALRLAQSAPESVIGTLKAAGLNGRGGGSFPVWKKWLAVKESAADTKYVVCNADEGEPGTGKDRVLIERNPRAIIEGMAVCAAVVAAKKGYIYLRGEYADLRETLEKEIAESPLEDFEIEVFMGHGAYVCGEETALLNSIEGKRGETRLKPPYPGVNGLWACPTVINNAETFACVPFILEFGAENFRRRGCGEHTGTRLYTVLGKVARPGVYELGAGAAAAELLEAAGGAAESIRAVQTGGGSGEIVPADCMEPVMGTGSIRFIGESEDLVTIVRELTEFYAGESCGVCVPCRVGLKRLAEMLGKKRFWPDDVEAMAELCAHIEANARCGLAKAAVKPALSLINNFPEVLK